MEHHHKLVLGIIPDGNRKSAKNKGISLIESYIHGAIIAGNIIEESLRRGDIGRIIFYALSEENYRERTREEINAVFTGIEKGLELFSHISKIKIECIGDSTPPEIAGFFHRAAARNVKDPEITVSFLFNYSPAWDFATRPIRSDTIPAIDLIIRHGETRLSGFLPLQSANAQFYFLPGYWSDFTITDFNKTIEHYKSTRLHSVPGK